MGQEILARLAAIEAKLARLETLATEINSALVTRTRERAKKARPLPLSPEEIATLRASFGALFARWMEGHEVEVHDELDRLEIEQLRRFADANNLNVTSKMPKKRVLELISARFREKRQLHRSPLDRATG